jgi:hypothetical protein
MTEAAFMCHQHVPAHVKGAFIRLTMYQRKSDLLYAFFWVIPRRLNFICRRFGTPCMLHLHRRVGVRSIQKKAYSIQNTPKVGNQEKAIYIIFFSSVPF